MMRKKDKKPLTPEQQRKRVNFRRGWVSAAGLAMVLAAVILAISRKTVKLYGIF